MSKTTTAASGFEARLVRILDRYLAALQEGAVLDKSALLAEHPDLAEDLEACLASLEFIRHAAVRPLAPEAGEEHARLGPIADPDLGILGDFRILREVGRGGMGVVYEAEQISLGRRVALKVLPFAAALDQRQLQRFKVEAHAAAQLHHTHIVPVFTVGVERGVHFYAMQFIAGRTLAEVIRELRHLDGAREARAQPAADDPASPLTAGSSNRTRSFFRAVAELGIQAAEALEYAHSLSVIHRDIKPANLLIDARGSLWVTDFGLAQFHAEPGLTITGDLVGTLRYMSPEQALGRRGIIDYRTDIYALGATLYELLTLTPAFPGDDRQQLLRQIADEEPIAPRRHNPTIPRELETIVLKAMAKEPESRYATAQNLAEDLRRFLESKPIKARRPSLAERAAKWARRHMALVTAALVVLMIAVASLATSTVLIARARSDAQRQRDEARRAVDAMYTQVAEKWLAQQPKLEAIQRDFLIKALGYYQQFSRQQSSEPHLRQETAQAYYRVGQIQSKLGRHAEAEKAYHEALNMQEELMRRFPSASECRRDAAASHAGLGFLLRTTGRSEEAIRFLHQAIDLQTKVVDDFPGDPGHRSLLARHLLSLSQVLLVESQFDDAERAARSGLEICRALNTEFPGQTENRRVLAQSLDTLGGILSDRGRPAEGVQLGREAVDVLQKLAAESPPGPNDRLWLAVVYGNLGNRLDKINQRPDALDTLQRSATLMKKLVADFPSHPMFRHLLTLYQTNLGETLRFSGQTQKALEVAKEARTAGEALAAEHPDAVEYREQLGRIENMLGQLWAAAGRFVEAEESFAKALVVFEKLAAKDANRWEYLERLGATYSDWVDLLTTRPTRERQADAPGRAIRLAEKAVARLPRNRDAWRALGRARYSLRDWKGAKNALDQARALDNADDCDLWLLLALAHGRLGERDQARGWYAKAAAWIKEHHESVWSRDELRLAAAALLCPSDRPTTAGEEVPTSKD
jgi:tetratricopeptide (TPR) repeat protein